MSVKYENLRNAILWKTYCKNIASNCRILMNEKAKIFIREKEDKQFSHMETTDMTGKMKEENQTLQNLISKVKGTRTLKQFSKDTGVSLSMLSRYINGRGSKPSPRTLMKLASPGTNPQNGVTCDDLLIAADYQSIGTVLRLEQMEEEKAWDSMMTPIRAVSVPDIVVCNDIGKENIVVEKMSKHELESKRKDRLHAYQELLSQKEAIIKSIILDNDALYNQGWRKISRNEIPSYLGRGRHSQLVFRNIENQKKLWIVEVKCEVYDKVVSKDYLYRRVFMQQMGFYAGLPMDENRKVTVVTESEGLFAKFVEHEDCSYRGDFSLMLMDLEKYQIVDERYIAHI